MNVKMTVGAKLDQQQNIVFFTSTFDLLDELHLQSGTSLNTDFLKHKALSLKTHLIAFTEVIR